jgi:uncharacterized membrane protein YphA (DoxX/SURF4 family)
MSIVRTLARPLLAGVFVVGGLDTWRTPEPRAKVAEPVLSQVSRAAPGLPLEDVDLVRANAATQVTAAAMLALGIRPRLAAATLAASIVPTTLGGHRFWEHDEAAPRAQQRIHFFKNLAILGGLLLATKA